MQKTFMERRNGRPARPAGMPHSTESCAPEPGFYGCDPETGGECLVIEEPTLEGEHGTVAIVPDGEGGFVQEPFVPEANTDAVVETEGEAAVGTE